MHIPKFHEQCAPEWARKHRLTARVLVFLSLLAAPVIIPAKMVWEERHSLGREIREGIGIVFLPWETSDGC